jgi:hypothetical protein
LNIINDKELESSIIDNLKTIDIELLKHTTTQKFYSFGIVFFNN